MKWCLQSPKSGDMVRVKTGEIYHYGIFVTESEVIQFGLAPVARSLLTDKNVAVCVTDVAGFLCGGILETGVPEVSDGVKRSPEEVISYARSKIGQLGYNIIHNNCEHFAYECFFGIKKSNQAEELRNMFRNRPKLDVYIAKIPTNLEITPVQPTLREEEILSCTNPRVKVEKFYAWKVLTYALYRSLGLRASNLTFTKTESGKWLTDECFFSISHSNGVVAVAVSRSNVGVDIEKVNKEKCDFIKKVLTEKEVENINHLKTNNGDILAQELTAIWSKKESFFKMTGEGSFNPRKIDVSNVPCTTKNIKVDGEDFVIAVSSNDLTPLRYFENFTLS